MKGIVAAALVAAVSGYDHKYHTSSTGYHKTWSSSWSNMFTGVLGANADMGYNTGYDS